MISTVHGRAAAGSLLALTLVMPSTACPRHERPSPPAVPSPPPAEPAEPTPTSVDAGAPPAPTAPVFDPPPPITTAVDPAIFQWAHPTDEDASFSLVIHLDGREGSERLRELARAQAGRTRALTDIGWPKRFARGDTWLIFTTGGSTVTAKVRGFWPTLRDDDTVELRVLLGRAPDGLAVRPRDWKRRPHPTMALNREVADDDPAMAEIEAVLGRASETAPLAELVEHRTLDDVQVFEGRFVGGTHLVCIRALDEGPDPRAMAGVVLIDLGGRVTSIVPAAPAPYAGHYISGILDLDGDGYEEAIIERAGSSNSEEHLLYWREGQPMLESLVGEPIEPVG